LSSGKGFFVFRRKCRWGGELVSFLTPGIFDALILIVIAVGLILAARRIYTDFTRGPNRLDPQHKPEQERKEQL
jgi:hypothetical protein